LSSITVLFLKLYSYIHFWNDVRIFISKKKKLIKTDSKIKELQGDLYKEIEEVIDNYPKNMIFSDLVKFLFTPVLCFQFKYPTTHRIRKRAILNYSLQFIVCLILLIFITGQYMIPTIKNSLIYINNDDYYNLVERILKLAIPTVYGWIIMFYAFFHSWLNLWAEITQFGDRTFYKDWWNSLYLDEYWRTWNLVNLNIKLF
jgi:diacylglycerol O-acyltransferase 1